MPCRQAGRHGHPGPRGCCSPSGLCMGRRWALSAAPGKHRPCRQPKPTGFLVPSYLSVQAAEPLGRQRPSLPAPCPSVPAPCCPCLLPAHPHPLALAHHCLLPAQSCLFPAHPYLLLSRCCPVCPCLLPTRRYLLSPRPSPARRCRLPARRCRLPAGPCPCSDTCWPPKAQAEPPVSVARGRLLRSCVPSRAGSWAMPRAGRGGRWWDPWAGEAHAGDRAAQVCPAREGWP